MSLLILFPASEATQPTTGTASFAQSGSWDATASERLTSTGTFVQTGSWAAAGTERITSSAAFAQSATWAGQGQGLVPVTSAGDFAQDATWAATAAHTDTSVSGTGSFIQNRMMTGVGGQVKLKIMGYASRAIPAEYAQATGTPIEIEGP
jgi:hypothetical protein